EHALTRARRERRRRDAHLAGFGLPALALPLLDATLHDRHAIVSVAAEPEPEARSVVAALRVVAHDHRVVADAQARHRAREVLRTRQQPARMTRRGWGSGVVPGPVHMHGPG